MPLGAQHIPEKAASGFEVVPTVCVFQVGRPLNQKSV